MYEILLSKKAVKFLEKLPNKTQVQILNGIEKLRFRPEVYLTKLVGETCFKLRVGDYRVIVDIEKKQLLVLVIKIAHRKNVYKK